MSSIHLRIEGADYVLTRTEHGYGLTRNDKKSDHFHRSYLIRCNERGRPLKCSCPQCFHLSLWCKHLREVEKWWRENTPEGMEEQQRVQAWAASQGFENP